MIAPQKSMSRASDDSGFTLVEMLVVLTMAALVLALVPNLLRTGSKVQTLVTGLETRMTEAATLSALKARIEAARPLYETEPSGLSTLVFQGDPNRVRFVTAFEDGPAGGGLYLVDFGATAESDVDASDSPPEWTLFAYPTATSDAPVYRGRMAAGLSSPQLRYFGPDPTTGVEQWHDRWEGRNQLPRLIELTMTDSRASILRRQTILIPLAFDR